MDDMSELQDLILDEENTFFMNFDDFLNLFPQKWRNHEEAKFLFDAICERQKESQIRVKENIEEFIHESLEQQVDAITADDVIDAMKHLRSNLVKDKEVFDQDIKSMHGSVMKDIELLQDSVVEEEDTGQWNDTSEFQAHLENLTLIG